MNGATFANTITNFGTYDGLDLKSLAYSAALGNGAFYNAVTSQLTVTENGESENYALANAGAPAYFAQSDGNGGTLITDAVVCFCSGTRIRVARGEVSVEDLQVGDLAITLTGDLRAIRWLGHRTFDCRAYAAPEKVWPIRVAADAFGRNRPARDHPCHRHSLAECRWSHRHYRLHHRRHLPPHRRRRRCHCRRHCRRCPDQCRPFQPAPNSPSRLLLLEWRCYSMNRLDRQPSLAPVPGVDATRRNAYLRVRTRRCSVRSNY